MIVGLERFREFFKDYTDHFILIGGVAATEWFESRALPFRPTKDIDIVLIVESLNDRFLQRMWAFITAGKYTHQKSSGERIYYRFTDPQEKDYPEMIEIFSRTPEGITLWEDQTIVPIPAKEEASSLSAILMDDAYYGLVKENREIMNDLPMITPPCLMLMKARAWLDLTRRKETGQRVNERDIKKHRNDVFKLALLLIQGESLVIQPALREDLMRFLCLFPAQSPEWEGIRQSAGDLERMMPDPPSLIETIERYFALPDSSDSQVAYD